MSPAVIFNIQLALGYVPWLLFFGAYVWPRLKALKRCDEDGRALYEPKAFDGGPACDRH